MKTKGKGKEKGKAIIGIAMAVIMLASVAALFSVSSFALTDPEISNNAIWRGEGKGNVTVLAGGSTTIIIGETINFNIPGLDIIGASEDVLGQTRGTTSDEYETGAPGKLGKAGDDDYLWAVDVDADGAWTAALDMKISIEEPTLEIEIQDAAGKSIDSTTLGKPIQVEVSSNLFKDDWVKLKITGPEGTWTEKTCTLEDANGYVIDTGDWTKIGDYEIWVVTKDDGDDARGIDKASEKDTITIRKEEIEIKASTTTPSKEEAVTFTVTGPPSTDFDFMVSSHEDEVVMTHLEKNPLGLDPGDTETMDNSDDPAYGFTEGGFDATTNEDGIYKFVTKFANDRSYTFQVWLGAAATYAAADAADRDDIDMDVGKIAVTIDAPKTGEIGEDVIITVTASSGDDVDIVIDDILEFDDETLVDGVAEVEWNTGGKTVGTYTIEVYVNCDVLAAGDVGVDVEGKIDDADLDADETETIRLIEPGVDAEQLRNVIAEGDDYAIEGAATGVDYVDYVLIGPKGWVSGAGVAVGDGILIDSASVTDNEFSEDAISMTTGLDTGMWIALVLAPGRDGVYEVGVGIGAGDLAVADFAPGLGAGKNKDQVVAIIKDQTIDRAGSDDLLVELTFKVESPRIDLDPIAPVAVGEPLNVTGTTNREPETSITISTFSGPMDLDVAIAEVEWLTADEGVFTGTIDTTGAAVGTYMLEADDGDGHTDTITVEIQTEVPVVEPTVEPTEVPTKVPTEVPTEVPTKVPTEEPEPTPTEPPGFEAIFAIAGLLSIAYLVLRRRK